MESIKKILFDSRDEKYKQFHSSLMPTIEQDKVIGVRMPSMRAIAKNLQKDESFSKEETRAFLSELPHDYYEENILHALLISNDKEFDKTINEVNRFLPYIDNWAVCDTFAPKCFACHKDELWNHVEKWLCSNETYTVRFGIVTAMRYFLDDDFSLEKFEKVISVRSDEYYVNMAIAWYVSFALIKQYQAVLPYVQKRVLPPWVHNKSIQKACESYRIPDDKKTYLKSLKIYD